MGDKNCAEKASNVFSFPRLSLRKTILKHSCCFSCYFRLNLHFKHPLSSIQKAADANGTKTASCGSGSVLSRGPRQTMVSREGRGLMMMGWGWRGDRDCTTQSPKFPVHCLHSTMLSLQLILQSIVHNSVHFCLHNASFIPGTTECST